VSALFPEVAGAHVALPSEQAAATPRPTGAPRHRKQTARRLSELVVRQTLAPVQPPRRSTESTWSTAEP
jgi:hypothetical protein